MSYLVNCVPNGSRSGEHRPLLSGLGRRDSESTSSAPRDSLCGGQQSALSGQLRNLTPTSPRGRGSHQRA
jgi:hypothetical protein